MACCHASLCPIGHKNVTYSQPFICTTVKNWSLACNIRALIARQNFRVCPFDWPNVVSALDIALPSSLDHLNMSIQSADCNLPCHSTNKYWPYQCVQQLFVALTLFPYRHTLMVVMTGDVLISHQFIPYSHRDAFELVYQFGCPKLTIELLRWLSQSHYAQAGPIQGHPAIPLRTYPSKSISFKHRYKTFQCTIKIWVSSQVEQVINTSSAQKSKVGVCLARIHPLLRSNTMSLTTLILCQIVLKYMIKGLSARFLPWEGKFSSGKRLLQLNIT